MTRTQPISFFPFFSLFTYRKKNYDDCSIKAANKKGNQLQLNVNHTTKKANNQHKHNKTMRRNSAISQRTNKKR